MKKPGNSISDYSISAHPVIPSTLPPTLGERQQGALTLAISLAILMLSTLVTFDVSRAILMEQKITNNDARAKMAFEAAEAGLIEALAYLGSNPDINGNKVIDPVFDTNADGLGDTNTVAVGSGSVTVTTCDLDTVECANGGPMTSIRIVATGVSDDLSATRTIEQTMLTIAPLQHLPDVPVITRGLAGTGGAITIENLEGHSTVWAARHVSMTGNSHTAIANINIGYPGCMNIPQTCTLAQVSNANLLGPDVVENDLTLSGLNSEELFENFFGMKPAKFRESMVSIDTEIVGFSTAVSGAESEVVWFEDGGDWQNVSLGCKGSLAGQNQCTSENLRPCIVIVNGNLRLRGNNNITGLVYVFGDVELAGNTRIDGAIISSGDFIVTSGNMNVHYRSDILAATDRAGVVIVGAGTWKDF